MYPKIVGLRITFKRCIIRSKKGGVRMSWESLIDYYDSHPFENELENEMMENRKNKSELEKQEKKENGCSSSYMPDDK